MKQQLFTSGPEHERKRKEEEDVLGTPVSLQGHAVSPENHLSVSWLQLVLSAVTYPDEQAQPDYPGLVKPSQVFVTMAD